MARWFVRFAGSVALVAGMLAVPVVLSTTAPASAATVVDGCTIVSNPTATSFTNCPNTNFSGANLSGLNLSYADLAGATFAECPSSSCSAADLSSADLTQANLAGAIFGSYFIGTATSSSTVGADVEGADLSSANLTGAVLLYADFTGGANLTGANLTNANLGDTNLTDANLTDANLTGASLVYALEVTFGTYLDLYANLTGATFGGANFTGTSEVPSNQSTTATSQAGAAVTWSTATPGDGMTPGSCTPASGSTFPLFSSTVTCQVLDANGDVATGTFQVNVAPTTQYFTRVVVPSDGAIVQGQQVLDAAASDAPGVKSVTFEVSGGTYTNQVIATATPSIFGWVANWNPLNCVGGICVPNGTYSLDSVATDADGNTDTSTPISITLNIQTPTTAMVSPADGATVSGSAVSVQASASAPAGVEEVGFQITSQTCGTFCFTNHFIDAQSFAAGNPSVTGTISWDSYGYPNGTYTLQSFVIDQIDQENFSAPITVTIDNPLPVTLIPAGGATQSGTAALLDASASGPLIAPGVTFEISGGTLTDDEIAQGKATIYGWLATWNTTAVPNGTYTLNSVATYESGAIGGVPLSDTSAPITITVDNAPPSTAVGIPANGAILTGNQYLDASASSGVTQVQYELSGGPNNVVDQIISGSTLTKVGWLGGWNTTSVPDGTYTLNSVASYAGGVSGTSPPVMITVSN